MRKNFTRTTRLKLVKNKKLRRWEVQKPKTLSNDDLDLF